MLYLFAFCLIKAFDLTLNLAENTLCIVIVQWTISWDNRNHEIT
jgi:hypothetical protein